MMKRGLLAACVAVAFAFPSRSQAFDWYSSDALAWSGYTIIELEELDFGSPPGLFSLSHSGTLTYLPPPSSLGSVTSVTGIWVECCSGNVIGGLASEASTNTHAGDESEPMYFFNPDPNEPDKGLPTTVVLPGLAFDFGTISSSKSVTQGFSGNIAFEDTPLDPETWSLSAVGGGVAAATWFVNTSGPSNPFLPSGGGGGGGGGWDVGFASGTVNSSGAVAAFASGGAGSITIPTSGRTAGVLAFDSSSAYTFTGGPLVFRDDAAGRARLSVAGSATHTVSADFDVRQDLYAHVVGGSALYATGAVTLTSGVRIVKTGTGTLGLSRFTAGDVAVQEGTLKSTAGTGTAAVTGRLNLMGFGATAAEAGILDLTIAGAGMVIELPTSGEAEANAKFEYRNSVCSLIANGSNGGTWTDSVDTSKGSITSTAARVNGTHGIGYATSAALLGSTGGTFLGQTVDGSAVLLKVVPYGDADMDGDVDAADQAIVTAHMNEQGTSWTTGDFNYDGVTDDDDQDLLDANDAAF